LTKRARVLLGLAVVTAIWPARSTTVPEWTIRFVDAKGSAVANLPVHQSWRNYSFEDEDHFAVGLTDSTGLVSFPARRLWLPVGVRLIWPLRHLGIIHASNGPSSFLVPQCDLMTSGPTLPAYSPRLGASLPNVIVVKYHDLSNLRAHMPGSEAPAPQCAEIEAQVRNAG
jgi:hypothetical protein